MQPYRLAKWKIAHSQRRFAHAGIHRVAEYRGHAVPAVERRLLQVNRLHFARLRKTPVLADPALTHRDQTIGMGIARVPRPDFRLHIQPRNAEQRQ